LREVASHAYLSHIRRFYEREEVYSYFDDFFGFVGAIDRGLLLDCGSGTGHVSQRLNELGIDTCVLSLDVNLHLLSYARDTRNLEFPLRADVFDLPLRDCTVTGVVLLDVIEHLEQPLKALREIRRVMVRGGKLILITPNGLLSAVLPKGPQSDPTHVHEFLWFELKALLHLASFDVERASSSGIPLLNRLNQKLARRVARSFGTAFLPFSHTSFWVLAKAI
jgi:SAM-dependent methyltransferase